MGDKEALIKILMLDAGIVPVASGVGWSHEDPVITVKKMIEKLPPDQKRLATRKFRKLWRKAYRKQEHLSRKRELFKGKKPTVHEQRRRIYQVCKMLLEESKNF